jgi:hypothetical protein
MEKNGEIIFNECDSGFFSTCTIILTHIINYFNKNKTLPKNIDTQKMFGLYKINKNDNILKICFDEKDITIPYTERVSYSKLTFENQFSDYKQLNYNMICPFINKYYNPSNIIIKLKNYLLSNYNINTNNENLCGVFYRGNDKIKETQKPSYNEIISKAIELKSINKNIQFIIQTDEKEFLNSFLTEFPNSIYFKEIPTIKSSITTVAKEFQNSTNKINILGFYLSSILIFSQLKQIIMTSGNGEMFICFYRGNAIGVHQYLKKNEYIYGEKNMDYDINDINIWY